MKTIQEIKDAIQEEVNAIKTMQQKRATFTNEKQKEICSRAISESLLIIDTMKWVAGLD